MLPRATVVIGRVSIIKYLSEHGVGDFEIFKLLCLTKDKCQIFCTLIRLVL